MAYFYMPYFYTGMEQDNEMKSFNLKLRLRHKIIFTVACIVMAVSFLARSLVIHFEKKHLLEDAENNRNVLIDMQADALVEPLWNWDNDRANDILSFFERVDSIVSVRILDENKDDFSKYVPETEMNISGVVTKEMFHADTPEVPIGFLEVSYSNDLIQKLLLSKCVYLPSVL